MDCQTAKVGASRTQLKNQEDVLLGKLDVNLELP